MEDTGSPIILPPEARHEAAEPHRDLSGNDVGERWEYRVFDLHRGQKLKPGQLAVQLGELGDVGWEIVQIDFRTARRRIVIMKRRRPSKG